MTALADHCGQGRSRDLDGDRGPAVDMSYVSEVLINPIMPGIANKVNIANIGEHRERRQR